MPAKNNGKRVVFGLHAPEAKEVYLLGTFNNWDPVSRPLKRYKDGVWKATITLVPGAYEYRFLVDGCWTNDPRCAEQVPNEFGEYNCLVRV